MRPITFEKAKRISFFFKLIIVAVLKENEVKTVSFTINQVLTVSSSAYNTLQASWFLYVHFQHEKGLLHNYSSEKPFYEELKKRQISFAMNDLPFIQERIKKRPFNPTNKKGPTF